MRKQTICVIGSGWGTASFIKNIDTEKYDVVVISPNCNFLYTPLLPYSIFNNIQLELPIKTLNKNIKIVKRQVVDVDLKEHKIILETPTQSQSQSQPQSQSQTQINYDIIIFSHGASINTFNIPGVDKYCEFIKNSDNIERIQNKIKHLGPEANVVVVGCGPTGVETIGYLMDKTKFNLFAVDALDLPLSMYPVKSVEYLLDLWKTKNIQFKLRSPVMKITENEIITQNEKIKYDFAFWCGGVKPNELTNKILQRLSINKVPGIPINDYLQIKNGNIPIPNTYAIGDCSLGFGPLVAQKAVQQGIHVAKQLNTNIYRPFVYNSKGQVTYIGDNKSLFCSPYFVSSGNVACLLNKCITIYNAVSFSQMREICVSYISNKKN